MTPLKKRMIEEMQLRHFAPKTIGLFVDNVAQFAKHFGKSPEVHGEEEVRRYLVHLVEERKLSWGTYNQALAALRRYDAQYDVLEKPPLPRIEPKRYYS